MSDDIVHATSIGKHRERVFEPPFQQFELQVELRNAASRNRSDARLPKR
jgi:hypothetical protein